MKQEEKVSPSAFALLTFLLWCDSEARHDVKALRAVHHQRASAALRLGGAGRGTRTQTARKNTVNHKDLQT